MSTPAPPVNNITVFVGDDLDFNVAGLVDKFLQVDLPAAEGSISLGLGQVQSQEQIPPESTQPASLYRLSRHMF